MMSRLLALCLGLLAAPVAVAQGSQDNPEVTWYQIEVIVFENDTTGNVGSETWPDDPGAPLTDKALELIPWALRDEVTPPDAWLQPAAAEETAPSAAQPLAEAAPDARVSESESPEAVALTDNVGLRAFVLLPDSERKLGDAVRRLGQSRQHRVLLHAAWRQPLRKSGEPQPVHLHSTTGSPDAYREYQERSQSVTAPEAAPAPATAIELTPEVDTDVAATLEPPAPDQEALDGTLTVSLNRYLHLDVDLLYRKNIEVAADAPPAAEASSETATDLIVINPAPTPDQASPEAATATPPPAPLIKLQAFHLSQSRRMRSNEVHYIDHPMLGVLAQITPVTAAQ